MKTEFESIFPLHLEHDHSDSSGIKTKQFPLGLFDCNENKTQQVIRLLKQLTEKYVPLKDNGEVIDEVFFGEDRFTDERIQSAQQAMSNGDTPKEKLQGFISKIKDWHRMMNFLEHNRPKIEKKKKSKTSATDDQLFNYIILLFKLTGLLKNLDTAIDMADGRRSVRSAKYELPIFNTTNKLKYVIRCIHLTALSEETLSPEQRDRLILNRTVNIQGGKNNNLALNEYVEILNRDSKDIVTGHQTKESIIAHSKQYPHLIKYIKHFDIISEIRQRKGFHKLPQYKADVMKVAKELIEIRAFEHIPKRKFVCKELSTERNPFINSYRGLSTMIDTNQKNLLVV
ncbi:unnamed protein product [Mytilus coruscus]|uniref:DUF6589 domain-containing protein n=1 Tax=Mytilus coruscus TaxID=42192 RepID=A0A6J8BIL2_MYTCO|nr:unnamed protein product [Mytilus coruscus]